MGFFIGRFGWEFLHHCASGYRQGAVLICSLLVWSSLGDAVEGNRCVFSLEKFVLEGMEMG